MNPLAVRSQAILLATVLPLSLSPGARLLALAPSQHSHGNATEAPSACEGRDLALDVVVMDTAGTPASILKEAGLEVTRIWSAGGMRLSWTVANQAQARPDRLLVPVVIWPTVRSSTSTSHRPRPLGWVAVDSTGRATGTIEIPVQDVVSATFSPQKNVKTLSSVEEFIVGRALGRVIAHEIGHWLFGPGHTGDGLMTRVFDPRTLSRPGDMPLPRAWTDDKGRLIARASRCLAGGEQTRDDHHEKPNRRSSGSGGFPQP
jgi:hypothetical protein